MNAVAVAQAPLVGLSARHPERIPKLLRDAGLTCRPKLRHLTSRCCGASCLCEDAEREIAFRGEARYVQRLARGRSTQEEWLDPAIPFDSSRANADISTRCVSCLSLFRPAVSARFSIEVKAAGMNFRDVLKALALYPGEAPDARIFGDEVAGIVKAVGAEWIMLCPGDRVFGLAVFGLASHTLARGGDLCRIPARLSFEQAAALPVVFMTAWHALQKVARIRKGETILVHAGAGGVGMAAVQIAHYLGAQVIASAGNPAKRCTAGDAWSQAC